jgi:hypothetical protein
MKLSSLLVETNNYDLIKEYIPTVNSINKLISTDITEAIYDELVLLMKQSNKIEVDVEQFNRNYKSYTTDEYLIELRKILKTINVVKPEIIRHQLGMKEVLETVLDHIKNPRRLDNPIKIANAKQFFKIFQPFYQALLRKRKSLEERHTEIAYMQDISNSAHTTKNVPIK